jgi:membrane protease subunit HflC
MIVERQRIAAKYRSEGEGEMMEIRGKKEKEEKVILSKAYRKAEEAKGKADAEAIKIYADAYSKDPEFYSFLKTLETYEKTLGEKSVIILSTDSDYFKYLKSGAGKGE